MKFRPCIDIHNGKVKQIVGGTLIDTGNQAKENFVSDYDGGFYAKLYKEFGLTGGHIILLNPEGSEYYDADVYQAKLALTTYPQGLQIGGGMNSSNAKKFLDMGASHIIVTSYVFNNGNINYTHLNELVKTIGKEHIVLDLSCRKRNGQYFIVTNRWQTFTDLVITETLLDELSLYCDEFLIHAVDVEGKSSGIEIELVTLLGKWNGCPITYAGGVSNLEDLKQLKELGNNHIDVTIGSALDLFGGKLSFDQVLEVLQTIE